MPYLYGHNLRLRSAERTDIPQFLHWVNDPEVVENLEVYAPIGTVEEEGWFDEMKSRPIDEHNLVIEVHPEGYDDKWEVIGNTSFFPINQKTR